MSPRQLDQEEVLSGRMLKQGEVLGKVGNFFQRERATTYHLHFDMQVPTKYGWVFVNPYMTLVAAYEHLIGGRGTEIKEEPQIATAPPAFDPPLPEPRPGAVAIPSEGEDRIESSTHDRPDHVAPDAAKGTAGPRLGNRVRRAGTGLGPEPEGTVRPMGRGLSAPGDRARRLRRDLRAGHERPQAGHHRL
jgi:murein DD-endopeptidase MepM/ murein hydrolase activator NlpD